LKYKDYYETLGVPRDATAEQVKKAYRRLARKFHPDVSKEPDAAARMQELNEAKEVLADAEKRAAYDALGRGHRPGEDFEPPPDWDAGFEFSGSGADRGGGAHSAEYSDFFAELFARMGQPRGGSRGPRARQRGEDHHARVTLDIEDAWRGALRQVSLRAPVLDAQGRVVLQERTLEVRIPAGVREGQLIRLAGQGSPGSEGEASGDLFLEVHFRPHPRFRLDGRDLRIELPVAPWEAALGAVVGVAMPDGSILKVRVPAGAQSGRQLFVKGRGLPGEPPGDLDLDVRVVLPPAETPRARELYEAMARDLAFDPRAATAGAADA
jgi:curved DNA-binding protein